MVPDQAPLHPSGFTGPRVRSRGQGGPPSEAGNVRAPPSLCPRLGPQHLRGQRSTGPRGAHSRSPPPPRKGSCRGLGRTAPGAPVAPGTWRPGPSAAEHAAAGFCGRAQGGGALHPYLQHQTPVLDGPGGAPRRSRHRAADAAARPWPLHTSGPDPCWTAEGRLVSEQFLQTPQKLSPYSWYGSARLFRFRVPPDTVLLRWLLGVARAGGPACAQAEVTVHFRYGAPPVINPLGTDFAPDTSVRPSFFVKMLHGNSSVNLSHPAPGDWFVAAHLPPASQKIEVQGFIPACAYVFQPDMLLLRAVEAAILEPGLPLPQTLRSLPSYLK
ncbi:PREDICTED: transmembrane protein 8A [Condylura cristata]|uniref:transmembrane protein 8A n=1 Tax=Condylura cristata TaxID=143302 RepID=UPI0006438726|nr:PREDICTED: transmembrane protein 8A [Condylura cristata]